MDPVWNCSLELLWEETEQTWNATVLSVETQHIFLPSVVNFLLHLTRLQHELILREKLAACCFQSSWVFSRFCEIILYGVLEISPIGRSIAANKK